MATQIIFDNEFALSLFYEEEGILHHTFHKPIGGDDLRQILMKAIETLERHNASKWLSDARNVTTPVSEEDRAWTLNTWLPMALNSGWKYWALVVPESQEMRVKLKEFVDFYYELGIRVKVFLNLDDARDWLNKQGKIEPGQATTN